ncbi:MAG: gamma-glutamyltransferase family protein [Clostridiales bacterium]|jgi:gamma-glutamyltranspeptidase/glutathione hydrolase|nr:gamma-glutamyltransferase family protein [Clostridiales bacterium]
MKYDSLNYYYPSRRNVVYGTRGMVATTQPLAAQAGLEMIKKGGNAIDAAIAAAACLTVVEPVSNGIGGDLFAIVWAKGEIFGLNSSGPAPMDISVQKLKEKGIRNIPKCGWIPVTVPGIPAGWAELWRRFGRLKFPELLSPAIHFAREGYAVSPTISMLWKKEYETYKHELKGEEFRFWFETFAPEGRAPEPGEIWKSEAHAQTLEEIGDTQSESFYQGRLADVIDSFSKTYGGFLRKKDLAAFKPEWVKPVSVNYRGYDVWEIPPNGHGIVALMALNLAKGFSFTDRDSSETCHRQIESMKLAYADGLEYISDPKYMTVDVKDLLSESYAEERRKLIGDTAIMPIHGRPSSGGTVYLAAADGEGNMVSLIQSNYNQFGSGLVVPGTGIALHNRGANFNMDETHSNCIAGGKKPYHTIIPGFLSKDGNPIGPFGVMGGFMQPQGHFQVIMNTIDFHLNPQQALDAPRWRWVEGKRIEFEPGFPSSVIDELKRRGHEIRVQEGLGGFGKGQIIWRTEKGSLCGGTEPRADGAIAVW